MKAIIFDSSSIISLAMNGLLEELKKLKENFDGYFMITKEIKQEIIDDPLKTKRYELEALKVKELLDDNCLSLPEAFKIEDRDVTFKAIKMMEIANSMFATDGKKIHLIHQGEASCIALSRILDERKIKHVVTIDERTLRMLIEKPENLQHLLEKRMHTRINLKKGNFKEFGGFKIIRSSELMYVAYKKGLLRWKAKEVLDAILYALRFKGCAISDEEIEETKAL